MAPPWPLPQGLLGEVASEGLLLSRRTSMEGGVGFRNSFLRGGGGEKGEGKRRFQPPGCEAAHVSLQSIPPAAPPFPARPWQLLGLTQGWSEGRPS